MTCQCTLCSLGNKRAQSFSRLSIDSLYTLDQGAAGPRGIPGMKGDPGETVSPPVVTVSPETQTVTENQTAKFYCSARGNPKPMVTWSKVNGSFVAERMTSNKNGRLEVIRSTFNDSGDYMCTAISFLGRDEKIAKLVVESKKQPLYILFWLVV